MQRLVVITGASQGLGLVLAQEFAVHGWQVAGIGRSPQSAGLPEGAAYHRFDASDAAACERFWQELHRQHPDAQVCLVNNAGGYVSGKLTESTSEDYAQMMQSCYFTSVYMTRELARNYSKARIINVVSASALKPSKTNSAYGAAKAAQMHFFQALQQEFAADKYQITNLYPQNIASHGRASDAMTPQDLAAFIRKQAESQASYYLRDVTLWPSS